MFSNPQQNNQENTLKDGVDIIYWINLDRSQDRKQNIQNMFQDNSLRNIPNVRIKAVDGKTDNIDKYIQNKKTDNIKSTEYACTISHLNAIQEFSKTEYNIALILEDDVCLDFKPYWKKSIKEMIDSAPKDWDIIQLCYIILGKKPDQEFELDPSSKNLCSTAAYIINNHAAKKLMQKINYGGKYQLEMELPHQADRYLYKALVTYCYKYPFFIYRTENDSYIHPEHVNFHNYSKNLIKNMYDYGVYDVSWWYRYKWVLLLVILVLLYFIIKNYTKITKLILGLKVKSRAYTLKYLKPFL